MHKAPVDLPDESLSSLAEMLNARLADGLDLHGQIKVAHWNMKAPQLAPLHPLFVALAANLATYCDVIALRIVALGGRAMGTVRQVAKSSRLPEYPRYASRDSDHVKLVADRIDAYLVGLRDSRTVANKLLDAATVHLLTQIITEFEEHGWFLRALLHSQD